MKRVGQVFVVIGVALFLVGGVGFAMVVRTASGLTSSFDKGTQVRADTVTTVDVSGGKNRLWSVDDSSTRCRIVANGRIDQASGSANWESGGHSYDLIGTIHTDGSGPTRIACDGRAVVATTAGGGDIVRFVGSIFAMISSGVLAFISVVVGLVLWLIGRGTERRNLEAARYAGPPPYSGGPSGPPPWQPPSGYR